MMSYIGFVKERTVLMKCNHNFKIEVSGLVYCKKCNKYMHPVIDGDFKQFVEHLNKQQEQKK